jgi:hypothetical protein
MDSQTLIGSPALDPQPTGQSLRSEVLATALPCELHITEKDSATRDGARGWELRERGGGVIQHACACKHFLTRCAVNLTRSFSIH